jgi:hypothetical protein
MADLRILYVEQDDDLGIGVDVRAWSGQDRYGPCFHDYVLAWRKGRETHKEALPSDICTDAQAIRAGIARYDELVMAGETPATEVLSE